MSNRENVIAVGDWHVPFHDKEALNCLFRLLKEQQPDEIVLGGNINDCSMFSKHPKKREVALAFKTAREEREHFFPLAEKLRDENPNAKITYIGSQCHEGWLEMWAAADPILVDDPNYLIPNWFKLKDFGIEFVEEDYVKNGFVFTHGTCCRNSSGASAKQEYEYHGCNGASFHVHRLGSYYKTVHHKPFVWFECGCMCQRQAWYRLKGKKARMDWQQGFLSIDFMDEVFSGQLIPVVRDTKDKPKIFYNGEVY